MVVQRRQREEMALLVDGVDHVYVPMPDASAAFAVLAEQLELPVLWPFTSFGAFSSGGPAITLVAGDDDRVDHLALAVRSAHASSETTSKIL